MKRRPWTLYRTGAFYSTPFLPPSLQCYIWLSYVGEAPVQGWARPSSTNTVNPVPCESCRECSNEVSGQLTALSCHMWVAMAQRASCSVLSVLCVYVCASLLCLTLWGTKGSHVRSQCGIRWMRHYGRSACLSIIPVCWLCRTQQSIQVCNLYWYRNC